MNDLERRQRRLDRARTLIHAELVVAVAVPLLVAFLYLAAPGDIGPMFSEPPWFTRLLPWAGIAGVIVGLVWMVRLSRADPEAGDRTWRYRDSSDLERRRRRLARVHNLSRMKLVILVGSPLVAGLLWVLAPGSFRAMFLHWSLITHVLPWAGIVGAIVGIAWILYISRDDPEAGDRTWRYRDF